MRHFYELSFHNWLEFVFNRSFKPQAIWKIEERMHAKRYDEEVVAHYIEWLFKDPSILLQSYSLHQINSGLEMMLDIFYRKIMVSEKVNRKQRIEIVESTLFLFQGLFASERWNEKWQDKAGEAGICYMWFDICLCDEFLEEYFTILCKILEIPSKHCQFSALHGLGELIGKWEDAKIILTIENFINNNPYLEPKLKNFAGYAKLGQV